jgi:uncharacterized protein
MACLSSRIPYGEVVTPEKLRMIEAGENVLRDLGFFDVRVRHHELRVASGVGQVAGSVTPTATSPATRPPSLVAHLARIEVGPAEMEKFLVNGTAARVAEALKAAGYAHVTLDLQGYRRGSTNELLLGSRLPTFKV